MFQPSGCETKRKGNRCEAHVLAALTEADLNVLVPWGDNARYDLVVEIGSTFLRIQCKAGRYDSDCASTRAAAWADAGGHRLRAGGARGIPTDADALHPFAAVDAATKNRVGNSHCWPGGDSGAKGDDSGRDPHPNTSRQRHPGGRLGAAGGHIAR